MQAIKTDYRKAPLAVSDRQMLDFAAKLARTPEAMNRTDTDVLRAAGFGDDAIGDIVQVVSLFSYYNRVADGLGIDLEPEMPPEGGAPR